MPRQRSRTPQCVRNRDMCTKAWSTPSEDNSLGPGAAGTPLRSKRLCGASMCEGLAKEPLQLRDDLLEGFELGLLVSRRECSPVPLCARVLNKLLAERDDLAVWK